MTAAPDYDLSVEALSGGTAYLPDDDPQPALDSSQQSSTNQSPVDVPVSQAQARPLLVDEFKALAAAVVERARKDANTVFAFNMLIELRCVAGVDEVLERFMPRLGAENCAPALYNILRDIYGRAYYDERLKANADLLDGVA
jgi:hypothetical protein